MPREAILTTLVSTFEPLEYIYAMWEGGARSFGRLDEWSDIDLQFDVADERVEDTLLLLEKTLEKISPIALKYRVPEPTYHGHAQVFLRLQNASPFLLIDACIMQHNSPRDKFLDPGIHGPAVFHFDKKGLAAQMVEADPAARRVQLLQRLDTLRVMFSMFQVFVEKEIQRGNALEALAYYQSVTLRPLVEVLRIRYQPARSGFYTRYAYYDLPLEIAARIERLSFVSGLVDICAKQEEAIRWFEEAWPQARVAMQDEK